MPPNLQLSDNLIDLMKDGPRRLDCLADDAVRCEPVSAVKFPANREINREFCRIRPSTAILMRNQRADSIAYDRAQHEAWRQSDLNQREYCEAHGLSLKAFGNWRAKFKAEPQLPPRKLLYRRGGLSHRLSHARSHSVSHMTNGLPEPALTGHRRAGHVGAGRAAAGSLFGSSVCVPGSQG